MKKRFGIKKLIVLIAILILIIIGIIVLYEYKIEKSKENYRYEIMRVYKPQNEQINNENEISLKNIEVLNKFNGQLPISTITKKIKNIFIEKIPDIKLRTDNMNQEELKGYYQKNRDEIRRNLRIDNEENFINLISNIREVDCDLKKNSKECEFFSGEEITLKYTYSNGQYIVCTISGRNANNFVLEF